LPKVNPLLEIYGTLVALELALKDHRNSMQHGHDVVQLAQVVAGTGSGTNAAATQLERALSNLPCTGKNGDVNRVARNYAFLRYIRHVDDHPGGASQDDIMRPAS